MNRGPMPKSMLRWIFLISSFAWSDLSVAQDLPFTLDVVASSGMSVVNLTVPPNGIVPITLIQLKPENLGQRVDLHLSEFANDTGGSIKVDLAIPEDSTVIVYGDRLNVKITKTLLPFQLIVPRLPTAGKYIGRLIVTSGKTPLIWVIALSRGKPLSVAELAVDRQTISLAIVNAMFHASDAAFTVALREKRGEWPLEDVSVSLEQVSKAPKGGFDFDKINFAVGGKEILGTSFMPPTLAAIDNSPPLPGRLIAGIAEGGQVIVAVRLHDLEPGEYNATLRFRARNSIETDAQKVVLSVKVRNSPMWAVLLLLAGILISYTLTRGLVAVRQRSTLRKRISDLNQQWLRAEPSVLSVIWARATLRQAEDLTRSFWLSSPDVIDSRLSQVEKLLPTLKRIREIRMNLEAISGSEFVTRRALASLRRTVSLLGEGPPDEKIQKIVDDKLDTLSGWSDEDKLNGCYVVELKEAIRLLLDSMSLDEIEYSAPDVKEEILRLVKGLKDHEPSASQSLDANIEIEERYYARLKTLWERRREKAGFEDLVRRSKDMSFADLFNEDDNITWVALKKANDDQTLKLNVPKTSGPEAFETYESLSFSLSTGNPQVDHTFLFERGLRYDWTFTLRRLRRIGFLSLWKRQEREAPALTPTSVEPRLIQYAPWPCSLTPSVRIMKGSEQITLKHVPEVLMIGASGVFRWYKGLQRTEGFSLGISIALGVVTGMATLYYASETFGSAKDYLTLVLWGAGVDQTKTFLQVLQTYTTKLPQ